jgi:glycosyltransferase involved in cell wall biosynthesis
MMADLPRISIVTPSYNQAQFLEETIQSVLGQVYPNLEYIIMDGGSTDGSAAIIQKYAHKLAYWVSEPDEGQTHAISKGFDRATGEILVWLNSDDVYVCPDTFRQVVSLFDRYPQADAISGAGVIIDRDGQWVRQTAVLHNQAHFSQLRYRNAILQPATFFKRRILDSVKLDTSLHYAFDWDFFIRLSRDFNLLVVNNVWAGYRMWGQNKTASGAAERAREQAEVVRRYLGPLSWQYVLLRLFCSAYRVAEGMPDGLEGRTKSGIRFLARAVSAMSYRRFPVV